MVRTSCLRKPHCVPGSHILSREDTLSLPKWNPLPPPTLLATSLQSKRSSERATERASDRASERQASDERQSLLRRKTCALLRAKTSTLLRRKTCVVLTARTCALFKANTKGRPAAATTKVAARPSAARPPLWFPLYWL